MSKNTIVIPRPDDWHLHLRDGDMLKSILPYTSKHFGRAIIMPNLVPPVVTTADAIAYENRIRNALPKGHDFKPLMTLYLTETTDPKDVVKGYQDGVITALKLYPAGATTNSESGVRNFENAMPVLEKMAEHAIPLCVHGEVTDADIDIFDREAVFIETVLDPLRQKLPELKVIMEHITTEDAVNYVEASTKNLAATITTHHLIINRNAILVGGIKPHYYCLPVAKREKHRVALVNAATSGDARYFLGTDSAPHLDPAKESACGCAGIFSSLNTMACLAHVFEAKNALDKLEGFASRFGPQYYGLEVSEKTMKLVKREQPVAYPEKVQTGEGDVHVFDPGFDIYWEVEN